MPGAVGRRLADRPSGRTCAARLRSGQTQQTVNLSAQAFGGSNPPLATSLRPLAPRARLRLASHVRRAGSRARGVSGRFRRIERNRRDAARQRSKRRQRVSERVGGSNSVVESQPSKLLVAGSIPVSRSSLRSALARRASARQASDGEGCRAVARSAKAGPQCSCDEEGWYFLTKAVWG